MNYIVTATYSPQVQWKLELMIESFKYLGIEDKLYKIQNQHPYHYNSVNNANHILMDLKAQVAKERKEKMNERKKLLESTLNARRVTS